MGLKIGPGGLDGWLMLQTSVTKSVMSPGAKNVRRRDRGPAPEPAADGPLDLEHELPEIHLRNNEPLKFGASSLSAWSRTARSS